MSRLTLIKDLPRPDFKRVGPHAYRRLAGKVLITNEWGGRAFLSEEEYRRFLRGMTEQDPLWPKLAAGGFLRNAMDFETAARETAGRGLPAWRGPVNHAVFLHGGQDVMSLKTARLCLDFIFSAPGDPLAIELAAEDAQTAWPVLWFCVQYARRRAQWAGRALLLTARLDGGLNAENLDFLRGHDVEIRLRLAVSGAPDFSASTALPVRRVLALSGRGARDPAGWADLLMGWGLESVCLEPGEVLFSREGIARFLAFYEGFLDRLAERAAESPFVEEWTLSLLRGSPWRLPGTDVLRELAYSPEGEVFTSEGGLRLAERGRPVFRLGQAGALRYEDIVQSPVTRACLSVVSADNQPLCSQCAYKPYCAVPASAHFAAQGSVWGDLDFSPSCRLRMGLFDFIFSRWKDEKMLNLLEKWSVDNPP